MKTLYVCAVHRGVTGRAAGVSLHSLRWKRLSLQWVLGGTLKRRPSRIRAEEAQAQIALQRGRQFCSLVVNTFLTLTATVLAYA